MNYMGEGVLRAAVDTLAAELRLETQQPGRTGEQPAVPDSRRSGQPVGTRVNGQGEEQVDRSSEPATAETGEAAAAGEMVREVPAPARQ